MVSMDIASSFLFQSPLFSQVHSTSASCLLKILATSIVTSITKRHYIVESLALAVSGIIHYSGHPPAGKHPSRFKHNTALAIAAGSRHHVFCKSPHFGMPRLQFCIATGPVPTLAVLRSFPAKVLADRAAVATH